MPKHDYPTEYAIEKAGEWLYDKDGYCPFTRHKLESLLRLAFEAGATSIKKTAALTPNQREAVVAVLDERLAGGQDDLRDALGLTHREAGDMVRTLQRVRNKLASKDEENSPVRVVEFGEKS